MNTGRPTLLQQKINELRAMESEVQKQIDRSTSDLQAKLFAIRDQLTVLLNAQALLEGKPLQEFRSVASSLPPAAPDLLDAYATVAEARRDGSNGQGDWSSFDARSIRGLPKIEALVKMAEWAGGTLRMKEIGATLIAGGQSTASNPSLASGSAYGCLMNSRRFRKTGRGEYTLVK